MSDNGTLAPIDVAVCCQCGEWFAKVVNFVAHAKQCNTFQCAMAEDGDMRRIYEELLNLRDGALVC